MARALTSALSTLTIDDTGKLVNQPLIRKSLRDKVTAPAASNRSSNSKQGENIETEIPHKNRCPGFDAALGRIYRYTPVPTLILDQDLYVVEVSDSHYTFSGQSRDTMVGTYAYNLPVHTIPAPNTPTIYGALHAAITSKEVRVIEKIHIQNESSIYQLRITPVFEKSSLIYMVLEAQRTSKYH